MNGVRLLALAAGGSVLAIAACASFSDDGAAADAGADASGAADASERDAADAANPGSPVSIIPNGDFELGCAGWTAYYGPLTEVTAVELQHAGTKACQFCSVGDAGLDGSVTFFGNSVAVDASAGTAYSGEAWVRTAPGRAAPSKLSLRIDVYPSSGAPTVGTSTSTPALGDAYQRASALRILDAPAQGKIQLTLRSENLDTCFIVDDAALYLTK